MKKSILLLFAMVLVSPTIAFSGEDALTIPKKIPFKKGIHVPDAVRQDCKLETVAADKIRSALKDAGKIEQADHVSKATRGKALEMTITGLLAPGGGPFSGPKSVTIEGALWNNGKLLGSFKAERYTKHGHGTCNMLERDTDEIAGDIAKWLKDPKPDSRLGDAK